MFPLDDRVGLFLAKRLAAAACTDDGQRMLGLLAQMAASPGVNGVNGVNGSAHDALDRAAAKAITRIGIWERAVEDGRTVFVRQASAESRRFWADVDKIAPAEGSRAVVLLGESVARGYYYDPHYNPAAAMSAMLAREPALAGTTVVDLARVDCSRAMLLQLASESLALKPAAWVVFAGNNWNPFLDFDRQQLHEIGSQLTTAAALPRIRAYVDEACRAQAASFVTSLIAASRSSATPLPIVMVIPEFNLRDWRNEYGDCIPLLDSADAMQWRRLSRMADAALAQGAWQTASDLAQAMLALDRGAAPRTYELLAQCRLAAGASGEARDLLARARDAGLSIPAASDRSASWMTAKQRDLPARLSEHMGGALPDHRLFHDYCHLTAEGIRLAMAHTAAAVGACLGGGERSWQTLYEGEPAPPTRVLAEAHLMAAMHNARWGQSEAAIRHQCEQAVAHAPEIADTMARCLEVYVRRTPAVLCGAFRQLLQRQQLSAANFVAMRGDPRSDKLLSPALVDTMIDVLARVLPETAAAAREMVKEEHGLTTRPLNLLASAYSTSSCAAPEYGWLSRSGVFKAHGIRSVFTFVMRLAANTACRITFRIPEAVEDADATLGVEVNGVTVASLACGARWRTVTVALAAGLLRPGWNTLALQWPEPSWTGDVQVQRIASSLLAGEEPPLFPSFGELHSLTAAVACPSRT